MAIKKESFDENIKIENRKGLKFQLESVIALDNHTGSSAFDDMLKYIEVDNGIKLCEPFDEKMPLIYEAKKGHLTEDDFLNAGVQLHKNFCRERVDDVKKIYKELHPPRTFAQETNWKSAKATSPTPDKSRATSGKPTNGKRPTQKTKKEISPAVVAVAVIAVVAVAVILFK